MTYGKTIGCQAALDQTCPGYAYQEGVCRSCCRIPVSENTFRKLSKVQKPGETLDQTITRLYDYHKGYRRC